MLLKQRIQAWLMKEERLQRHPFLRRLLWKRGARYRFMEQRAAQIRKKEVITVAFMALDLPCWKNDSLFRLMLSHPRFRPVIWIVPELQIKDEDERQRKLDEMRRQFAEWNYPVADMYSLEQMRAEYAPDIVFLAKPYCAATPWTSWDMDEELVCYVPYCYINTNGKSFLYGQENNVWRNFYATRGIQKLASSLMSNGGSNVVVSGAPIADAFLYQESDGTAQVWKACKPGMKRIIWAPHWSVNADSWFNVATFLDVADGMLELVEKYADQIQWAFKPHPLLRDTLYLHPDWGKERTDAYYERWESMPNSQLETGAYELLFKQSDAMVHDSGSFILEYLLVDKPCMYLQREEGFSQFNEDTIQALRCYQKGSSVAEIEQFLLGLLHGAPDVHAAARERYRKQYLIPPGGESVSQNIINAILKG